MLKSFGTFSTENEKLKDSPSWNETIGGSEWVCGCVKCATEVSKLYVIGFCLTYIMQKMGIE